MTPPMDTVYADICQQEGCEPHLYKDERGLITTGPGFRVATVSAALALPWMMPDGHVATDDQVSEQYAALDAAPVGHSAPFYARFTSMRIGAAACRRITEDRLRDEFLPALRRHFPHFDDYAEGWQRALIDVIWNVGVGGILKFGHLAVACESGDGKSAGLEAHARETRADGSHSPHAAARNRWRASMFETTERTS